MSYAMIQNRGELPLWGVRLLGYNQKTDKDIGQFGTGLKESIALLARMGELPIIFSGTCRIDLEVRGEPSEIHFKLSKRKEDFISKRWYGMGIHPDFGKSDWNDPWMVFRELFCNALDESGVDDLYHDVVSTKPTGVAGSTRVYLPLSKELLSAYSTVQDKLLMLSDHEVLDEESDHGRVIAKREAKPVQIFTKGVWVQEGEEESLFDYELTDLKLNESRSADWYKVTHAVGRVLAGLPVDLAVRFLCSVIKEGRFELYEASSVAHYAYYHASVSGCQAWVTAFYSVFGENAVICTNEKFYYDKLTEMGKKGIVISDENVYKFLKEAGLPYASNVLTYEQTQYETLEPPTEAAQKVFDDVWERYVDLGIDNGKEKPNLMIFRQREGLSRIIFGEYKQGTCYINKECLGSEHERIVCVEEIAHHITQAPDLTTEFQYFLSASLAKAL